MDWLMTRLVGLGAALLITLGFVVVAGLISGYISERTKPPPKPPQEYIINLQPAHPH